jgi:MFS family permease
MATRPVTIGREFKAGWPILVGANLGTALGVSSLPALAISVFLRSLQGEFGWSRAEISLGPTLLVMMIALASPGVGWIADRLAVRWITATGLGALALSLFLFSRLGPDLHWYYLGCAAMALTAAGAGTVPYARAISANFVKARGLALGLGTAGSGLTAIFLPLLLSPYAAEVGWRRGYISLAVIVGLAVPVVGVLMARTSTPISLSERESDTPGLSVRLAARDRVFWTLALCFVLIPLSVGGLQLHLLSFLADSGLDPSQAGRIASLTGVVQIPMRLLCGWLFDRLSAIRVASVVITLAALSLAGLAYFGPAAAFLGPLAFGLAMGLEIDLVGYLTASYFGMQSYGRLYGLFYADTLLGAALSPLLYGHIFDATGSYALALDLAGVMLLASAILFLTIPRSAPHPAHSLI